MMLGPEIQPIFRNKPRIRLTDGIAANKTDDRDRTLASMNGIEPGERSNWERSWAGTAMSETESEPGLPDSVEGKTVDRDSSEENVRRIAHAVAAILIASRERHPDKQSDPNDPTSRLDQPARGRAA
jgi:hypothetical protein